MPIEPACVLGLQGFSALLTTSRHPVRGEGASLRSLLEIMMPSLAKRTPISLPARKGQPWRWHDYVAMAVSLLFVTAMLFSFRINDWVMHTFAWGY
jgi:hypothetical protein